MMLLAPTIVNDARKLYISPQPVSFMNISAPYAKANSPRKVKGIDFLQFFEPQQSNQVSFVTALRMNASFPYIAPSITLPSQPEIQVMDAGISDNYGIADAIRFIYTFREWLSTNTSGVLLLSIRDSNIERGIQPIPASSIIGDLATPISRAYNNFGNIQDLNNAHYIESASTWLQVPITTIYLMYDHQMANGTAQKTNKQPSIAENRRASLNWHLTSREKNQIINSINSEKNQEALQQLLHYIGQY